MTDPYVYPGTQVLKNRLDIRETRALDIVERQLVTNRIEQGTPKGRFDLNHMRAIHRHLFQDIYDWAGQIRTVEIQKGGNQFQFRQYIETGMADIYKRLEREQFLKTRKAGDFAAKAAEIIGDINYVHPFREGNGRTQMEFLVQLADRAGHQLDVQKIEPAQWMDASKASFEANYDSLARCIESGLGRGISLGRSR